MSLQVVLYPFIELRKAPLAFCLLASVATHALADSRLDEVLQNGTLTVCTTGDYKPYTSLRADGRYEGILS